MGMSGLRSFETFIKKQEKIPDKILIKKLTKMVDFVHPKVLDRTPVYSGKTLRNWQWTERGAGATEKEAIGSGPTGQTSKMALGQEPRRKPNQADPNRSKASLNLSNPYKEFILINPTGEATELEYGQLPSASRSRNPSGMVRVTVQELILHMQTGKI